MLGWIEPKRRRSLFLSLLFLWCAGRGTGKSPKVFENVRRADAARDGDRNGQQALLCVRRARKIRMAHWSSHSSNLIYHVNGIDSPFLDWMPLFIFVYSVPRFDWFSVPYHFHCIHLFNKKKKENPFRQYVNFIVLMIPCHLMISFHKVFFLNVKIKNIYI